MSSHGLLFPVPLVKRVPALAVHLVLQAGQLVRISLDNIKVDANIFYHHSATVILTIEIPEINYIRSYKGEEGSAMSYNAISYATHLSLVNLFNDPVFQKYVKCY